MTSQPKAWWWHLPQRGALNVLLLALLPTASWATDIQEEQRSARLTPAQAYAVLAATGYLDDSLINGNLDLARIRAPTGSTAVLLRKVTLAGKLVRSSGPQPVSTGPTQSEPAVEITQSKLARIDLAGATLRAALALENSVVEGPARFDGARFEGRLVLHNVTFSSQVAFRGVRFAAPVDITYCTFNTPLPAAPDRAHAHQSPAGTGSQKTWLIDLGAGHPRACHILRRPLRRCGAFRW